MLHMSAKKRRGISRKREIPFKSANQEKDIRKGFLVSIISIAFLWWIPIVGPLMAGYVTGRQSGNAKNALMVSLIMSAMVTFVSLYMISSSIQSMSFVGHYLSDGIYAFSGSALASTSNLIVYTQTFNGVLVSMGMILPSSLIIFNSCSFLGGTISKTAVEERGRPLRSSLGNYTPNQLDNLPRSNGRSGTRVLYEDANFDDEDDIDSYARVKPEEETITLSKI